MYKNPLGRNRIQKAERQTTSFENKQEVFFMEIKQHNNITTYRRFRLHQSGEILKQGKALFDQTLLIDPKDIYARYGKAISNCS